MDSSFERLLEAGLGDAKVGLVSWKDLDVVIHLWLPDDYEQCVRLHFTEVSDLTIVLKYGRYSGQPLLFSADVHRKNDRGWRVRFDFGVAPDGFIEFDCAEIACVGYQSSSGGPLRPTDR